MCSTILSLNAEQNIVDCWNSGGNTIITRLLKNFGVSGKDIRVKEYFNVSGDWLKFGGNQISPPKTDIIIGEYKISVKNSSNFQIVSGNICEIRPLLFNILSEAEIASLDIKLSKLLNNIIIEKTIGWMKRHKCLPMILQSVDDIHHDLNKIFDEVPVKTKKDIMMEAFTGRKKFGENTIASAEYSLMFGKYQHFDKIENIIDCLLPTKISFSWKTRDRKNQDKKYFQTESALRMRVRSSEIKKLYEKR